MSGEFLTVTLAAGETKQFQKAGRYLEIIADGGSSVNLTFYGDNGAVSANWNNCQSGLFLEDPWGSFSVTNNSASAQTITMLLMDNGRGGSRRQPGIVTVTYPIGTGVQLVEANDTATASASGFQIARTLVTPAANLKGIRIHSSRIAAGGNAAGTTDVRLIASPIAPTSTTQANAWAGGQAVAANSASVTEIQQRMNVTIPAGWGLYIGVTNTGTIPPGLVFSSTCFELVQ